MTSEATGSHVAGQKRQVTTDTPSGLQQQRPKPQVQTGAPAPFQSPRSGAALALSILCQQRQAPQQQQQPVPTKSPALALPSSVPSSASYPRPPPQQPHPTSYQPWQGHSYSPYHSNESPFVAAKRLKVSHEVSPRFPAPHGGMPMPRYAPSPYHPHPPMPSAAPSHGGGHHRMQIFVEATRSFAPPPPYPPPTVTPTPKKPTYSRKSKSLGLLCENFVQANKTSVGEEITIDDTAKKLGVERRRIYDIVNIFESLQIVVRRCKNTYSWVGTAHLPIVFGKMQEDALAEFEQDAVETGMLQGKTTNAENRESKKGQKKSLGRLSQQFIQLFLVGHKIMSLTEASDKILGPSSPVELAALTKSNATADLADPRQLEAAASRGLKTKIRRLYDIANVFVSLKFIKKMDSDTRKSRPTFEWVYDMSAEEIRNLHVKKTTVGPNFILRSITNKSAAIPVVKKNDVVQSTTIMESRQDAASEATLVVNKKNDVVEPTMIESRQDAESGATPVVNKENDAEPIMMESRQDAESEATPVVNQKNDAEPIMMESRQDAESKGSPVVEKNDAAPTMMESLQDAESEATPVVQKNDVEQSTTMEMESRQDTESAATLVIKKSDVERSTTMESRQDTESAVTPVVKKSDVEQSTVTESRRDAAQETPVAPSPLDSGKNLMANINRTGAAELSLEEPPLCRTVSLASSAEQATYL